MSTADLIVTNPSDGVTVVTLNRPAKRNALNGALVEGMIAALDAAETANTQLFVVKGNGASFCAGFDLSNLDDESDGDLLLRFVRIEMLLQRIYAAPFTTVACGTGLVVGAGADVFAACDRRLIVNDARFMFPGLGFGLILGTGRLIARVGDECALDIVRSGRELGADEALEIGLATARIAEGDVEAAVAREWEKARRVDHATAVALRAVRGQNGASDLAHLVHSAARPGLKTRIQAHRDRVQARTRSS